MGDRVEIRIDGLSHDGQGVGRHDGMACFVPGALPGERVAVRLLHRARRHWLTALEAVLETSLSRRRPPCILADHCGGCSLQHLRDDLQSRWKGERVQEALERIGGLTTPVEAVVAAPACLGYRNRAIVPLERRADGSLRAGYYRRGTHRIVNMNHCPVLDPRLDALIAPLKQDLEASGWPVDRELEGQGGLRHLALRLGHHTGEVLLTLVSSHAELEGLASRAEAWRTRWPQIVGVTLNLQPQPTNTLLGPHTELVAGRSWLRERFCGEELRIASDTFFQVNTAQAERVLPSLQHALEGLTPGLLVDAYCGIGTFSLPLARGGWRVHGLERNPEAVRLAALNASINGLSELASFEAGDVAALLPPWLPRCQALFLDPPRRGLDGAVMAALQASSPPLLLYLSCDPATLARDLGLLTRSCGYTVSRVQPLDFFPQTSHIETLAVLRRAEPSS
ncbi:23S rRNA (uracil-5-)-methyltransferase [Cyanobium sp. PCC 7001]|uniref:23S rRNA (uracil(1939)-C(5))-methyltransferase RlmD n=1 Tax=Cyanobium sp. PCC 7001 TaxID=180281 RepID=UPI0001805685|nr:23S rRNA (uracil(1939)-C(5))-methyltransferase RlmD [Cyanobium sp. PCC 7001]EDY37420.1 23S rRNA (uracil-5-)-methyltransferase [Cyanobium sp. PCC 7001]